MVVIHFFHKDHDDLIDVFVYLGWLNHFLLRGSVPEMAGKIDRIRKGLLFLVVKSYDFAVDVPLNQAIETSASLIPRFSFLVAQAFAVQVKAVGFSSSLVSQKTRR